MYKRRDYWKENFRRTFSSWRLATGMITFVLYVVFIVVAFAVTPNGIPHSIELTLRIVAVVWLPSVALFVTPANMWIETKNECVKLRHGIAAPDKWRDQAQRFNGWSGRTILACWTHPAGNEGDRHWSTYLPSDDDRIEFELIVKEAGLRLRLSQYIKAKHSDLLLEGDDFVRWCEFAFVSLLIPYNEGFTSTSTENGILYETKSINDFHEVSRLLCETLAIEELVYASSNLNPSSMPSS